jgi:2-furoyl-CoA dehydrogenase large subunit
MSETYTDEVEVRGTPFEVWSFLEDAEALGRVLPGCERIELVRPGVYALVLGIPTPFMKVRADAVATLEDPEPPTRLRLLLEGSPPGFNGSFRVAIPLELEGTEALEGGTLTRIRYAVDAQLSGSLAMFGAAAVRDGVRGLVAELAANVEREIAAGRAPGAGSA